MSIWHALAGGLAGTIVLTTALRGASELGLTRMDLPFLLGTAFTDNRTRAKIIGYVVHLVLGILFSVVYYAFFVALGRAGWGLGALLGFGHAVFAGGSLVNVILPLVHPRMGTPFSAADTPAFLEPPGFMMLNYGRSTPMVSIVAHVAYGLIVGGLTQGA